MDVLNPLAIINEARKSVPAVNYALGLAGIAMCGAIIVGALGQEKSALLILLSVFSGMKLLFVFSRAIASKSQSLTILGIMLTWFIVIFAMIAVSILFCAIVFGAPSSVSSFLGLNNISVKATNFSKKEMEISNKIENWFCNNLNFKFDLESAISNFPLEIMPKPKLTQSREKSTIENDRYYDVVEYISDGDHYDIRYKYQIQANRSYGFSLSIDENIVMDSVFDSQDKRIEWISRFGAVTENGIGGKTVGVGQIAPGVKDYAFEFSEWGMRRGIIASWFSEKDISYSKMLCAARAGI